MSVSNAAIAQRLIRSLHTRHERELLKLHAVYATRTSTYDRQIARAIDAEIGLRKTTREAT